GTRRTRIRPLADAERYSQGAAIPPASRRSPCGSRSLSSNVLPLSHAVKVRRRSQPHGGIDRGRGHREGETFFDPSAFADRKQDAKKERGRHHARDGYTIDGMRTEAGYGRARALAGRSRADPHFTRVCDIVTTEFACPTAPVMLRLREHRLRREEFRL